MIKRFFLIFLICSLFLVACGREEVTTTPTPFGFGETAASVFKAGQPTAVALSELMAEPEAYAGRFLQLSGGYKRLPLLVCRQEPHPGPANWALVEKAAATEAAVTEAAATEAATTEGAATKVMATAAVGSEEIIVAIGGLDTQLRALVAQGTPLTVNGYWLYWEGPVGCGKQAVPRQVWYLRVTELVSPAQLARYPLTPAGTVTDGLPIEGEEGGETGTPESEEVATAVVPEPLTPTFPVPGTETGDPDTSPYPPPTDSATPDLGGQEPPVAATPTPTRDESGQEATATITGQPGGTPSPGGTPPPGVTGTPGPPTPTAQPGVYTIVEVDPLNPDESMYGLERMGAWQKQNWTITLTASDLITIGIAAEPTMNLAVAVYDETDTLLLEQNNAPAGQLEEVRGLVVDPDGTYIIQVYDVNGAEGHYFITIVGNEPEIVLYSRGILPYGSMRQDAIAADHRHFWYFYGQAGDVVDILTTANGSGLLLISLYDKDADLMEDDNGDVLEYVEEEIIDFTLPETGLYLIWLEEFAYEPASYTITVVKN